MTDFHLENFNDISISINSHLPKFNFGLQCVDVFVLPGTSLFQLGHLLEKFLYLLCERYLLVFDNPNVLPLTIGPNIQGYQIFINLEELTIVPSL